MSKKRRKHTKATIEKIRQSKLKNPTRYWLGKKFSDEHKKKLSETRIANDITGAKHPRWVGDKVNYSSLHKWVKKGLGDLKECVYCGKQDAKRKDGRSAIQLANISHTYKRDLSDWIPLCVTCHFKYDVAHRKSLVS